MDTANGPVPGAHNFHRGGRLAAYASEMNQAIPKITDRKEREVAEKLWSEALLSQWSKAPVWVHGDIAVGNILVREGKLAAVIDFEQLAIGDPACDLAIAWNFFAGESRKQFKKTVSLDQNTWVRALGWTLWKTLCWPIKGTDTRKVLLEVYTDYQKL